MMPDYKPRCVLCGIRYATEIHHIIPACAGGDNSEDYLIPVCTACHAVLTPKSLLSRIGLRNNDRMNDVYALFVRFWEMCEEQQPAGGSDVLAIFREWEEDIALPGIKEIIKPSRKSINASTREALLGGQECAE